MERAIKTFRQRGTGGDALVVKIDHEQDELQLEENLRGTTVDAARWKVPPWQYASSLPWPPRAGSPGSWLCS